MPNIMPINSLQDLLTIRELKNQANPTYSAIKALSDGVAFSIQQRQEEARAKKLQEEEFNNTMKQYEKAQNTFGSSHEIGFCHRAVACALSDSSQVGIRT
jgi:hypothetical protein